MTTPITPTTMRAAWYERKGPAREVLAVGELPVPRPPVPREPPARRAAPLTAPG